MFGVNCNRQAPEVTLVYQFLAETHGWVSVNICCVNKETEESSRRREEHMRFSVWKGATGVVGLFSQWNGIAGNDATERREPDGESYGNYEN